MPSRINGIGTWYWGKDNIITRNGTCEFCGTCRTLESYDTTLYFTVLFLPIIPLRRKRVIDYCPGCRRHRAIALRKWEEQKTDALMQSLGDWQSDRGNSEKAAKAIGVTIGFHDRHAFEDLAAAVAEAFARDPKMQIFVADGYDHFAQPAVAENYYRAANRIVNDASTRRPLGRFLLRQLRPDEARPLLDDVITTRDRQAAPMLLALAQSYQAVGNHEAAAALLDQAGTAFPDLLSDAEFQRITRISSKYKGTGKRIRIAGFDPTSRSGAKESSWLQRNAAKAVIAAIIIIGSAIYISIAASMGRHKVHIVNGTSSDYIVNVAGVPLHVPAKGDTTIRLAEGAYKVAVEDRPEIEPATIEINTDFWKRPIDHRTFVINPDRTAVLYARNEHYSADANVANQKDRQEKFEYYAGAVLYNLKRGQDEFVEPPQSVQAEGDVKRRHIDLFRKTAPARLYEVVQNQLGPSAAGDWLRRATLYARNDELVMLSLLAQELKPEEVISFLRPHLTDRPVRVDWHRYYQQMMEKQHPDYHLAADYRALLAKNPDDSMLTYLLGRVVKDRRESLALFANAAEAKPPCAYALYALAYEDLSNVRFDSALTRIRKAREITPNNQLFIWTEEEADEATGNIDAAIEAVRSQQKHDGRDVDQVSDEVRLLARKGDIAAAQQRVELFCKEVDSLAGDQRELSTLMRHWLDASLEYSRGNIAGFRAAMKQTRGPVGEWQIALIDGRFDDAEKKLAEMETVDLEEYLTLAALAGAKGNTAVADRAWTKVKDHLAKGDKGERALVAALTSSAGDPALADALHDWSAPTRVRLLMLTCLGQRYPQHRDAMFATAAKLNYATRFPHHQLAEVLSAAR